MDTEELDRESDSELDDDEDDDELELDDDEDDDELEEGFSQHIHGLPILPYIILKGLISASARASINRYWFSSLGVSS